MRSVGAVRRVLGCAGRLRRGCARLAFGRGASGKGYFNAGVWPERTSGAYDFLIFWIAAFVETSERLGALREDREPVPGLSEYSECIVGARMRWWRKRSSQMHKASMSRSGCDRIR